MTKTKPVADGSQTVTPYLIVRNATRALGFYREAFGAEELSRIPTPDGRLMSVQLRIGDGVLHLADEFPEMGVLAPPSVGGTPVVLALDVPDAEAVFAQAVAAGAEVRQPLAEMFWGDLHGQLDLRSGTAGTSLSTCATCRTTRLWPLRRGPSDRRHKGTSRASRRFAAKRATVSSPEAGGCAGQPLAVSLGPRTRGVRNATRRNLFGWSPGRNL